KLNIFGVGADENTLKEMANANRLSEKLVFHGKTADIRKLWSENHLLIMPSLMEGMPLAIVEAMLCGRPSVVTNVGDHAEWIRDAVDGFIAASADVSSLEKAMQTAWSKKESWKAMGISAHEHARRVYDPEPGKTLLEYIKQ